MAELLGWWVDLETTAFPLPPPVTCALFEEDARDDEDELTGSPEELFPKKTAEETSDRLVRRTALGQGMRTLLELYVPRHFPVASL
eukprot:1186116-Prorocentrum_minimum.AAC.3